MGSPPKWATRAQEGKLPLTWVVGLGPRGPPATLAVWLALGGRRTTSFCLVPHCLVEERCNPSPPINRDPD